MTKKISILLLLLLIVFQAYSQIEDKLIGEWKAIAVNNGSIYYSLKNDSISLAHDSNIPKENLELFRVAMKASISDTKYYFTKTQKLKCVIAPGYEIILIYDLIKDEEIIHLYEENSSKVSVGNIKYKIQDNNLLLKLTIDDSGSYVILEKVE